jgi:hypothetical protein
MLPFRILPPSMLATLAPFAPRFSRRVWAHVQVLLAGSLLSPVRRTVAAALRVMGLARSKQFHRYHRVLSHARWSSLAISRILLGLLVAAFAPDGPLVLGVDETLERRRGAKIAAKGIYHDAVRSSLWGRRSLSWVRLLARRRDADRRALAVIAPAPRASVAPAPAFGGVMSDAACPGCSTGQTQRGPTGDAARRG